MVPPRSPTSLLGSWPTLGGGSVASHVGGRCGPDGQAISAIENALWESEECRSRLAGRGLGEEEQAEVADLNFVAIGQRRRVHLLTVEVGAVEAVSVYKLEF